MSVQFSGTVGKTPTQAQITGKQLVLKQKNKKVFENNVWLVCFQRVSPRLKMCDAIFVTADRVWEMSIPRAHVESISDTIEAPIYHGGPDPLPWSQFTKNAKKYGWQQEDWQHLFEEESLSDEENSVDEDWVPDDEESSDEESSEDED